MTRSVLVTGVSGQVGSAVAALLSQGGWKVSAPVRGEMDLSNSDSIRSAVASLQPRWIVSCGAYTAVDAAESDRDAAFAINADGPAALAEAAAAVGAGLIHFSTDYVFDGSGTEPWKESDATGPLNVYGASKLAGEQAIQSVAERSPLAHVILRTSWVYSAGGKNFVRTMLRLLSTRTEPLRIVADQHGAPSSAADLAEAVSSIIAAGEQASHGEPLAEVLASHSGVYHCAGSGETTWAGLAGAVREFLVKERGLTPPEIVPVPSSEYPTPAARPRNSRLNCDRLAQQFGVRLPDWDASVRRVLHDLAALDLDAH